MTEEIQQKTTDLEQLTSDHNVLNLNHRLTKEELRLSILKSDDFEKKYNVKVKIEKELSN